MGFSKTTLICWLETRKAMGSLHLQAGATEVLRLHDVFFESPPYQSKRKPKKTMRARHCLSQTLFLSFRFHGRILAHKEQVLPFLTLMSTKVVSFKIIIGGPRQPFNSWLALQIITTPVDCAKISTTLTRKPCKETDVFTLCNTQLEESGVRDASSIHSMGGRNSILCINKSCHFQYSAVPTVDTLHCILTLVQLLPDKGTIFEFELSSTQGLYQLRRAWFGLGYSMPKLKPRYPLPEQDKNALASNHASCFYPLLPIKTWLWCSNQKQ